MRVRLIEQVENDEDFAGRELKIFFLPRVGEHVVSQLSGKMLVITRIEHYLDEDMILIYGEEK
jgi:hypothetical protein